MLPAIFENAKRRHPRDVGLRRVAMIFHSIDRKRVNCCPYFSPATMDREHDGRGGVKSLPFALLRERDTARADSPCRARAYLSPKNAKARILPARGQSAHGRKGEPIFRGGSVVFESSRHCSPWE